MGATSLTKTLLGEYLLTDETVTRPTSWFVALFVGETEVSGTGYERKAVVFEETATAGIFKNNADIDFGKAGSSWGTVDKYKIYTLSSGGDILIEEEFDTAKTIGEGITFKILEGDLSVTIE